MSEHDDPGGRGPDHTLLGADITETPGDEPKIYAVSNLRTYVKPDLDEELGAPMGENAAECGTEVLCTCVPVETCVCDTVTYHAGGSSCPGDCSCQCTSTCVSLYWHPY